MPGLNDTIPGISKWRMAWNHFIIWEEWDYLRFPTFFETADAKNDDPHWKCWRGIGSLTNSDSGMALIMIPNWRLHPPVNSNMFFSISWWYPHDFQSPPISEEAIKLPGFIWENIQFPGLMKKPRVVLSGIRIDGKRNDIPFHCLNQPGISMWSTFTLFPTLTTFTMIFTSMFFQYQTPCYNQGRSGPENVALQSLSMVFTDLGTVISLPSLSPSHSPFRLSFVIKMLPSLSNQSRIVPLCHPTGPPYYLHSSPKIWKPLGKSGSKHLLKCQTDPNLLNCRNIWTRKKK